MKIKALEHFQDGNIFGASIDVGDVIEVSEREYELVVQSGGKFQVMPDSTEASPIERFIPVQTPGTRMTKSEFDAKQLKEKQEFDAKQLEERQKFDADEKVPEVEFDLNLTDNGEAQATRAAEEEVEKRLAERRNKAKQAELESVTSELKQKKPTGSLK